MVEHRSSVDSSRAHCVAHMARTKQRVTCDHRAAVERAAARVRKAADIGSACLQPAGLLHAHCCRASAVAMLDMHAAADCASCRGGPVGGSLCLPHLPPRVHPPQTHVRSRALECIAAVLPHPIARALTASLQAHCLLRAAGGTASGATHRQRRSRPRSSTSSSSASSSTRCDRTQSARTRAPLPCVRTDSQATGPLPQARRNFQRGGGPQRNADSVAAGRNGQGPRDRDRYRSLTLDCCRPHHTIAHVWARLPGAAISRGTHSRPSRRHLLQASSKSAPHATLALWHARHARFCGSLSSEGQSRPNRHEQRELI